MKKPKITPGEWQRTRIAAGRIENTDGRQVCVCNGHASRINHEETERENDANAAAIAAVPELLEALEFTMETLRIARQHFPKSVKNADTFRLENTCATVSKALKKAGYEF